MESVTVGNAVLWTDTTGQGDTAVVFCHGGPGLSDNMSPIASMVDDMAIVHRFDQRGGGRSTGDAPYTVDGFVDDLEGLREHWKHRAWFVGGHSWGGWLALMYAMKYPARTTGIIGIGMPPPPSDGWRETYLRIRDSRMTASERKFFDEIRRRRRVGEEISEDEEQRWVYLNWRTDFADPEAAPDFSRDPLFRFPSNYEVNQSLIADMDTFVTKHDLAVELASVDVPALFVHGVGDPRPAPTSVVSALPDARLVRIVGAGHLPWFEKPTQVAGVLRAFLF